MTKEGPLSVLLDAYTVQFLIEGRIISVRYYFTEEDQLTRVRGAEIRAALVYAHRDVAHGRLGAPAPRNARVWMHGLGVDGAFLAPHFARTAAWP